MKPFDHEKFIGYISEVSAQTVLMQFPVAPLVHPFYYHGSVYLSGSVGSFVVIEGTERGFLGRLIEVSLPQGERKEITDQNTHMESDEFHPIGRIELLAIFNVYAPEKIEKTISRYPTIGSKVYSCSDEQISLYVAKFGEKKSEGAIPYAEIGKLTSNDAVCNVSINSLFGRHCAVVGTTGGGKSWTVATLLEMVEQSTKNKCILIDATGEYADINESMTSISIGTGEYFFDYKDLTIDELTFLLRPSSRVQLPKLMEAIRSLKMCRLETNNELVDYKHSVTGNIVKSQRSKEAYNKFMLANSSSIERNDCDFDFMLLPHQIYFECVWDTDSRDDTKWGGRNDNDYSNCMSLINRTRDIINTAECNSIFAFNRTSEEFKSSKNLIDEINKHLDGNKSILRLDFSSVSFDYQVREILVNAIGKYLLQKARAGAFKKAPVLVFVDEAHQFLNKNIRDEYFDAKPLDAFEQISKEARKYGLFICIATQMPRDIPLGTLSQMGTFIVHRLINEQDKKAVESAASAANRNILSFLPILGEGEAVIVGVDYPMPLTVKIKEPTRKPDSNTPKFACK